ncbi:ferredoxin-type protein NapF, partial [Edwardsiella tarda]
MSERRDERYYRAWMSHRHVSRRGLLRGLLGGGRAVQRQALQAPLQ